jgi:hypothetical protein
VVARPVQQVAQPIQQVAAQSVQPLVTQPVQPVVAQPVPAALPPVQQVAHTEAAPQPVVLKPAEGAPYRDISSAACFDHADDYAWLAGQVECSRLGHGRRLRYASIDNVDKYGGSVTLQGDSSLERLKDGNFVKVRGHVIDPGDSSTAPAYHVEAYEFVASR